jgi:diguanylate cyclase (GGDEF)-like protein
MLKNSDSQHIKDLRDYAIKCIHGNSEYTIENFKFNINENTKYILFRGKILYDENGNVFRFAGSVTDVTEQNIANDKVKYLAYYDTLTNLPNKISLRENIPELFKAISKNGLRTLVLIDVDNFKYINEVYGHEIGDELIIEIAKRLKKMKSLNDILYYAGAASFALYSDKYVNKIKIGKEAEAINNIIASSYLIKNNKINITASIGISSIPLDSEGTISILQNAEIALNYCKINKKNSFVFFTNDMENNIRRKVTIYNDLITAVKNEQFVLYYQPKVNIINGKIEGMEALIRWNHPTGGIIPPLDFIPIAEETGIIVDIGYYVIKEACTQIRKWHEKGFSMLKVAVNLSIKQLMQIDFVERVEMILNSTEVMPEWLEFEITESLVMKNYENAISKINEFRNLGITIALDDFGTGYSSLNYLSSLPIDSIKLDKTFIDKIIEEEKSKTIIQAFILLAHSIKLNIVAEGVETEEQLCLLKQLNCDVVQGYFFSKPLKPEEFEQFIMKNISEQ